jgi:1-acyl-sn-glycerol-3-phosphate acyltransferase
MGLELHQALCQRHDGLTAAFRKYGLIAVMVLWTTLVGLCALPAMVMPRRAAFLVQRVWSKGMLWFLRVLFGVRYTVRGQDKIPPKPVIIAAKHQSTWDTIILTLEEPPPAFVIKQELLRIPLYGWYCRATGMIPVDRQGGASALRIMLKAAERHIGQGRNIVIFPEGTRVPLGVRVPYQVGVASLYKSLGVPVVPVALNSGHFWPKSGLTDRRGTITMEYLEPIPPGLDKKTFLATLETRLEEASAKLNPDSLA